jgi:phospholipase C
MENRSFDHYLGWVVGADGSQARTYFDSAGQPHSTHNLTDWTGCGFGDPGHSYNEGRVQFNGGACDGFIKSGSGNDDYALGYYVETQLPTNSYLAHNFTVCDHWFASILGPTYPNRFYTHSAATDRISNSMTQSTMATIWDSLAVAGYSANYYFSDLPFIGLYGPKYAPISRRIDHFFVDAALGTLPAYSYLDPYFLGETQGASNDDHPHADIRRGQNLIGEVVDALIKSPAWPSTVLIITYDEWGGFFDHVPPPSLPDAYVPTTPTEEHNTAGFRVPAYIVSPFSPVGVVNPTQFDHSSILKLVESTFGLPSLTPRDAASNNIADILDFSSPNLTPAPITVPADPGPNPCTGVSQVDSFWHDLAASPLIKGYAGVA